MKNFKFKERQELLEQKIQEYYKDNEDELFKGMRLKKETF